MKNIELLNEYKELYYKEIEFKDSMNNKISTSITFLTVLCTGHMFMWDVMIGLHYTFNIISYVFLTLELISVYYTMLSMYNFHKSYFKYEYRLVSAEKIKSSMDENTSLDQYYSKAEINKANYDMMCNTFYNCCVLNRHENIRKSKHQMNLNISIIKAIVTLILTYTMWIFIIKKL